MNAHFDARTGTQEIAPPADGMSHLSDLMQKIAQDETLPAPAPESVFVGDGDYRAIGLEYLGHYVTIGGLKPTDRVLDIGCGIGRMAVPLTQYLDPERGFLRGRRSRQRGHRVVRPEHHLELIRISGSAVWMLRTSFTIPAA